jgi:hypothetical protein
VIYLIVFHFLVGQFDYSNGLFLCIYPVWTKLTGLFLFLVDGQGKVGHLYTNLVLEFDSKRGKISGIEGLLFLDLVISGS